MGLVFWGVGEILNGSPVVQSMKSSHFHFSSSLFF